MSAKYIQYKLEDWIIDEDFIQYVNGADNFMKDLIPSLSEQKEVKENINEARRTIISLSQTNIAVEEERLDNLFDRINLSIDSKTENQSLKKKSSPLFIRRSIIATAVAASLALLLIFNPFSNGNEFSTQVAEQKTITLPDNSIAELNNVSKIIYNEKTWEKERTLELEGEAFFKVEKGSKFTVLSKQGSVSVLGTQFNVSDRDGHYSVECLEGKVSVKLKDGTEYILTAGDRVILAEGMQAILEKGKMEQIDWINKFEEFKNVPAESVLAALERYYNIEFTNIEEVKGLPYEGFFITNSLDSAINQVLWPLGKEFKIDGNKVTIE